MKSLLYIPSIKTSIWARDILSDILSNIILVIPESVRVHNKHPCIYNIFFLANNTLLIYIVLIDISSETKPNQTKP